MIRWVGEGAVAVAAAAALVGLVAGVHGRRVRLARALVLAQPMAVGAAVACLLAALARSDMGIASVAHHTERSLPMAYKLAALWAGQEGSLLLLALVLSVVGAASAWGRRREPSRPEGMTLAVCSGISLVFAALLLTVARPFAQTPFGPPDDGWGLNPMLQHWAMVLHPPTLFAGYACTLAPFAMVLGGLAAGDLGFASLCRMRRWALAAWVFLTCGILLGAWWAYVELGWGGYWAWDPVENASLMPWLAATALLHTLVVAEERRALCGWAAGLACLSFLLCLAGTTLTRSGLLVSVHAFGKTTIGSYLFGLLVVLGGATVWLLVQRRGMLRSEHQVENLLSRDGLVLAGNVLLTAMLGATLIGTLFPVVSGLVLDQSVGVGAPYYNRVVGTLGLALALLMAAGPIAVYGDGSGGVVRRAALTPLVIAGAGVVLAVLLGVRHPAALVCLAIAVVNVTVILASFVAAVRVRAREATGWGRLTAVLQTLDANHRRYGGQLAHAGLCVLILGLCGSGLFAERAERTLATGESTTVHGFTLEYRTLAEVRGENYSAMEAVLLVTDARGRATELRPQRRYYDKAMEPVTEVALRSRLTGDLYVVLASWSPGGAEAALSIVVNPLVAWIWIGGGMMAAGGSFAMLPRVGRRANNAVGSPDGIHAGRVSPPQAADHGKDRSDHA